MPIDQVAELLASWRGAGGVLGRARVLREGMQVLGGLDATERRVLARSLGEQGAPHLAARIEERTGGAMNADQLWIVADGLLNMEDDQVDQLAASLRDPSERERLARQALTHGMASFDLGPSVGSDPRARLDELPPPGGSGDGAAAHTDGSELGGVGLGDPELGTIELGTIELEDAGIVDVGRHEPEAGPGAAARAPDHADDEVMVAAASPASGPGDATEAAGLLARLREAETATTRLRILEVDALVRVGGATALAVLDALPDGWQRRRGALRLVDAGAFPTDRLSEALGRFARATDATFVAGALVAAGQVRAERFDGILPTRTVNRLTARSER